MESVKRERAIQRAREGCGNDEGWGYLSELEAGAWDLKISCDSLEGGVIG